MSLLSLPKINPILETFTKIPMRNKTLKLHIHVHSSHASHSTNFQIDQEQKNSS